MEASLGQRVSYHPFAGDNTPKGLKGKIIQLHEDSRDSRVGTVDVELEIPSGTITHLNVPYGYASQKSYVQALDEKAPGAKTLDTQQAKEDEHTHPKLPAGTINDPSPAHQIAGQPHGVQHQTSVNPPASSPQNNPPGLSNQPQVQPVKPSGPTGPVTSAPAVVK